MRHIRESALSILSLVRVIGLWAAYRHQDTTDSTS